MTTQNGFDALARASGLSKDAMKGVLAQVRANQAKLNACAAHAFEPLDADRLLTRYRCTRCEGEVDSHAAHWYARGIAHTREAAK